MNNKLDDKKLVLTTLILAVIALGLTFVFVVFANNASAPSIEEPNEIPANIADNSIAESLIDALVNRNTTDIGDIEIDGEFYRRNPNIETICFIGNDKKRHIPSEGLNGQADAIYVLAIDKLTGKTSIINIPRDSMVEMYRTYNGSNIIYDTQYQQICLAYSYGTTDAISSRNVCNCASQLLGGIPIDYYFSTQEDFIADIVDEIGPIEVTPLESIPDTPIKKDVAINMDGELASQYVLWRDIEHYKTALDRNARQRQFLGKLVAAFIQTAEDDPTKASDVIAKLMDNSTTDIPLQNVLHLAQQFLGANYKAQNDNDSDSVSNNGASLSIYALDGNAIHNSDSKWEQFIVDKASTQKLVAEVFYTKI